MTNLDSTVTPQDMGVTFATKLHLFGGFRLFVHGRDQGLGIGEKRLLAYLALGPPGTRSAVGGRLWPDVTERRAQGCLRTALWRLGRLGVDLVNGAAGQLALSEPVWVDVRALNRWIMQRPPIQTVPLAALRGGDLLPDWGDDWVQMHRERLRQLRLHALEEMARLLTDEKRFAEALDLALEAVHIEPLRESAHRAVITIHLAEGNPSEAIRQYRLFRRILRADLATEPSNSLREFIRGEIQRAAATA